MNLKKIKDNQPEDQVWAIDQEDAENMFAGMGV